MKLKINYFVIPLIVIATAALGSFATSSGMQWYDTEIIKPALTPPSIAFPIAWTTIFILTTISALIIWNKKTPREKTRNLITAIFIFNAALNVAWCFLFFDFQLMLSSLIEMIVLETTLFALLILSWRISKLASALLIPYTIWVGFATYLTYQILVLN